MAELQRLALDANTPFACTMLPVRRLYLECTSHKLGALVEALQLPRSDRAHHAPQVDAEMACHLWCRIGADVAQRYGVRPVSHALLARVQSTPRAKLDRVFSQQPCAA